MGIFYNIDPLQLQPQSYSISQPPWPLNDTPTNSAWNIFGNNGSSFQPFAVYTEKIGSNAFNEGDFLLDYGIENCPNQKIWSSNNFKTNAYLNLKNHPKII